MAEEQSNPYGQLIAKAWTDQEFKARLKADPKATMKEVGMDVPEGVDIEVVETHRRRPIWSYPPNPSVSSLTRTWIRWRGEVEAAPFGPRYIDRDPCRRSRGSWGVPRPSPWRNRGPIRATKMLPFYRDPTDFIRSRWTLITFPIPHEFKGIPGDPHEERNPPKSR
ncbi:MAG: nitrile hydratase subunit alpha [Candidatus Binatia bacterium]|nr:nitrile hydratase subunit alpha [Candidatus Binatia bacterium]